MSDMTLDRARRIMADGSASSEWRGMAGALLSEHEARLTAEREREELSDDLLMTMEVRNLALEEASLDIQTGPDGQDYLDRSRMIRRWLTAAYERHEDGERAHQLTDGPTVEDARAALGEDTTREELT